jgi:hypothetical protein
MLHKLSELDRFILWLREKPLNQTYNWSDGEACLMAQYLADTGQEENGMPDWYGRITLQRPWTFAAALQRAETPSP